MERLEHRLRQPDTAGRGPLCLLTSQALQRPLAPIGQQVLVQGLQGRRQADECS